MYMTSENKIEKIMILQLLLLSHTHAHTHTHSYSSTWTLGAGAMPWKWFMKRLSLPQYMASIPSSGPNSHMYATPRLQIESS